MVDRRGRKTPHEPRHVLERIADEHPDLVRHLRPLPAAAEFREEFVRRSVLRIAEAGQPAPVAPLGERRAQDGRIVEEDERALPLHLELHVVKTENAVDVAAVKTDVQPFRVDAFVAMPDAQQFGRLYALPDRRRLDQQEAQKLLAVAFVYSVLFFSHGSYAPQKLA